MTKLEDFRREYVPKFPEPKNLRLLLDLGVISKDSNAETATAAWSALLRDPVIAEREQTYPGPQRYREIAGLQRRIIRFDVFPKVVAEMTEDERAELRERLLARRVTDIPSATSTPDDSKGILLI